MVLLAAAVPAVLASKIAEAMAVSLDECLMLIMTLASGSMAGAAQGGRSEHVRVEITAVQYRSLIQILEKVKRHIPARGEVMIEAGASMLGIDVGGVVIVDKGMLNEFPAAVIVVAHDAMPGILINI